MRLTFLALVTGLAGFLLSQPAPKVPVGSTPGGGFLLNSGWKITPAGKQTPLDTFPMATALSRDGKFLLVLNAGYRPPSITVLETGSMQEVSRAPVPDGWLGLAFSPDGKSVYVGGGSEAAVFEFSFDAGKLTPARRFNIVPEAERAPTDFIGDVAVTPDGRQLYAAGLHHDAVHVINLQTGRVTNRYKTGRRPYRILFHPDGRSYFVTSWAGGTLHQHNALSGEQIAAVRIGAHPTDIVWRKRKPTEDNEFQQAWTARLFVTASNTNSVYVLGLAQNGDLRMIETINTAMSPRQPFGMTPSALALNADESRLFVACSDANAVTVVDVSEADSVVLGYVPAGWYPTAVRALSDGRLVIVNGKGVGSHPNPNGPNPAREAVEVHRGTESSQYVAQIQTGTASVIDAFTDEQLERWSEVVLANSPYSDDRLENAIVPPGNPVPARPGLPSPIQHVIYIVKENRTYDQVLGNLGKGAGNASLTQFDEKAAPNHRKLASEFVLLDNFYVNGDVDADGKNWSVAGIASDYVTKLWPSTYAGRRKAYDYEGQELTAFPPTGYLWSNANSAGVAVRNYGWWVNNGPRTETGKHQVASVRDPVLAKITSQTFRGFDPEYPDVERAKVFIDELEGFEKNSAMPSLILMHLGNDHTSGAAPGRIAPSSAMADNDLALGMIVEAVSGSKFWPRTAIFVVEDDAQNGPDHVDSHRSPAFVISPYARRGAVDSSMYNTTSVLRTLGLILGLRPMTHFDAAARPMWAAFTDKPDTRSYEAVKPAVSLEERNPAR